MMRRFRGRSGSRAVTPVVATILLVAITVVLAGVLYVMVAGIIGPGGGTPLPPTVQLITQIETHGVYNVQVFTNRADNLGAFRVSLINETSGVTCVAEQDLSATFNATCSPGVTVEFRDLANPGIPELNEGDAFRVAGVHGSNRYMLNLVWKTNGAVVAQGIVPA